MGCRWEDQPYSRSSLLLVPKHLSRCLDCESTDKLGHGQKDIIVRDAVALTASGPRFLTLGDEARSGDATVPRRRVSPRWRGPARHSPPCAR